MTLHHRGRDARFSFILFSRRFLWAALGVLFFLVESGHADTLYFRNGDRLNGKLTSFEENRILFSSIHGLEVQVDPRGLWTLETEGLVVLVFADGRILTTRLLPGEEGTVVSSDGEPIKILDIREINPPTQETKWTGRFSFLGSMARGNADATRGVGSVDVERRSEIDRLILTGGYAAGRQRDVVTRDVATTEKNYFGALQYDFFLNRKLYAWSRARAEADEVAELDLRLLAGAGVGYQWVERFDWTLTTEVGLNWSREDYATSGEEEQITARFAWRYRRSYLDDRLRFFKFIEWYPSLEDPKDHLVIGQVGFQAPLTDVLSAEFRVDGRWDSTPADGAERTDLLYSVGLNWTF